MATEAHSTAEQKRFFPKVSAPQLSQQKSFHFFGRCRCCSSIGLLLLFCSEYNLTKHNFSRFIEPPFWRNCLLCSIISCVRGRLKKRAQPNNRRRTSRWEKIGDDGTQFSPSLILSSSSTTASVLLLLSRFLSWSKLGLNESLLGLDYPQLQKQEQQQE